MIDRAGVTCGHVRYLSNVFGDGWFNLWHLCSLTQSNQSDIKITNRKSTFIYYNNDNNNNNNNNYYYYTIIVLTKLTLCAKYGSLMVL